MSETAQQPEAFDALLGGARVIPVVALDSVEQALGLGRALCEGGVGILEVTLRTAAALDAIKALRDALPELHVGCGTVRSPAQIEAAVAAGAEFLVAPAAPPELARALSVAPVPALPGATTPAEMMALQALGFLRQKFFPAESSGGVLQLQMIEPVLPELRFCPTGGVNAENAARYLACPNVLCVGGSWLTPSDELRAGAFDKIRQRARQSQSNGHP